jgi:AcrR family transcriptional regulator
MKREEIVDAAFRAWGRDSYRTNSLSAVSAELGVTKPALYKHFKAKEELLEAVSKRFFDRYCAALDASRYADFLGPSAPPDSINRLLDIFLDMFVADWEGFTYYLAVVLGLPRPHERIRSELEARGLRLPEGPVFGGRTALLYHFGLSSGLFSLALFHGARADHSARPDPEEAAAALSRARTLVFRGIGYRKPVASDYEAIDCRARFRPDERGPVDRLLGAIAAAVAEAGPWKASMELVSKKAGLSKSGLYAHFRNREDMLSSMFESEYERIAAVLGPRIEACGGLPDRLYAAMATTAAYLRERPEVLSVLDWVRAQRIDIKVAFPERILAHHGFLAAAAEAGECSLVEGSLDLTLRWIHFLVVSSLVHGSWQEQGAPPNTVFLRKLHRLVLGGIDMENNA